MNKLKTLLKAYFAPYENSGLVHGQPACTTDELAEAIAVMCSEACSAMVHDPEDLEMVGDKPKKPKKGKPAADAAE